MNEKAIIVGVNLNQTTNIDYELDELQALCNACEIDVLDRVTQNLECFNNATYIGKGKISEIKELLTYHDCSLVVFNDELSPSQIMNLSDELDCTCYDRTYIILEIFKRRSSTKEAYLQVEIARLKYMLPRLNGLRKGLSRQGGGRNKGKGEAQLELDKRYIQNKITLLKQQLEECRLVRVSQRGKRNANNMKTVSLVGYTNSGKSTLINAFLDASIINNDSESKKVFEKDMLFATLETSTRLIKLQNNHQFLVTDTVGFVEKLPHHLVEAFKSTLEEILESDLIIHVVDSSNPFFERQIETTNEVLKTLGVKDIPIIYAFNKIDKIEDYLYIPNQYPNSIRISARNKENLNKLINKIDNELFKVQYIKLLLPFNRGDIVNELKTYYQVTSLNYTNEGIEVEAYVSDVKYNQLIEFKKD